MDNTTLKISPDVHDLVFDGEGNLEIIGGADTVAQCVRLILECFKGQWFLDLNHGTDYDQLIDGEGDAETVLSEAIYQETAVRFINELAVDINGRTVNSAFTAQLDDGIKLYLEVSV